MHEQFVELGSYKLSGGVYYPFSMEAGSKQQPGGTAKITFDKIEVNVPMEKIEFQMPQAKGGR